MKALPLVVAALAGCHGAKQAATPLAKPRPPDRETGNSGPVGLGGGGELPQGLRGVRDLACGTATTCALTQDGKVYCWGDAYALGLTAASRPTRIADLPKATRIGAGTSHACALGADHRVYCWGSGAAVAAVNLPAEVIDLSIGATHACAIDRVGEVWCWGDRRDGKVGVPWTRGGDAWEVKEPLIVKGLVPSARVHAGMNATCAIADTGGALRCFGSNELGGLGVKLATAWTHVPQLVAVDAPVKSVSSGDASCAIDGAGRVMCWGTNDFGQAGDPKLVGPTKTLSSRPSGMKGAFVAAPQHVPDLDGALSVHAGGTFTCAIRGDRSVACWGNNELGALAAPVDNDPHPTPLPIRGAERVRGMCTGAYHACAIADDRTVLCWGHNASDQLGRDARSPYELAPGPVLAP